MNPAARPSMWQPGRRCQQPASKAGAVYPLGYVSTAATAAAAITTAVSVVVAVAVLLRLMVAEQRGIGYCTHMIIDVT